MSGINELIRIIRDQGMKDYRPSFFYAEVTSASPLRLKFKGFELVTEQIIHTNTSKALISANNLKIGDTVLVKANYDDDNSIYSVLIIDKVVG